VKKKSKNHGREERAANRLKEERVVSAGAQRRKRQGPRGQRRKGGSENRLILQGRVIAGQATKREKRKRFNSRIQGEGERSTRAKGHTAVGDAPGRKWVMSSIKDGTNVDSSMNWGRGKTEEEREETKRKKGKCGGLEQRHCAAKKSQKSRR